MVFADFEIHDCELIVEGIAMGADWCIAFEGDGGSFEITHVWANGIRAKHDEFAYVLAQRWFDGDLATGKLSRIRRAYRNHIADRTADDNADDRGCHDFHQSRAA